jgi:Tfp pilus assembly ATPase PilU
VDLRRLVAGFLRMATDVAIVGEVRDREGLPTAYVSRSVSGCQLAALPIKTFSGFVAQHRLNRSSVRQLDRAPQERRPLPLGRR